MSAHMVQLGPPYSAAGASIQCSWGLHTVQQGPPYSAAGATIQCSCAPHTVKPSPHTVLHSGTKPWTESGRPAGQVPQHILPIRQTPTAHSTNTANSHSTFYQYGQLPQHILPIRPTPTAHSTNTANSHGTF